MHAADAVWIDVREPDDDDCYTQSMDLASWASRTWHSYREPARGVTPTAHLLRVRIIPSHRCDIDCAHPSGYHQPWRADAASPLAYIQANRSVEPVL